MKRLAFFVMFMGMSFSAGCTEKADESSTDTETPETTDATGTTAPEEPTSTTDSEESTSTATTSESTTGDEPAETTDDTATGTTAPPVDEDCAFLVGKDFVSNKQTPCGPPNGDEPVRLCPETVSFSEDEFTYISGDLGVGGPYTCEAGVIAGEDDFGDAHNGTIDAASGVLEWDGDKFHVN